LVGRREVLTAAHCVAEALPNADFLIIVGGDVFEVSARYFNGNYDPEGSYTAENAAHDLGILILDRDVTETNPVPVFFNKPQSAGDWAYIYGYGTNELSGGAGRTLLDNGKAGTITINNTEDGLLSSTHSLSAVSTCPGDSGGPAVQMFSGFFGVIGTVTGGINEAVSDTCYLTGNGAFSLVDLQSSSSQNFLSYYSGVQYISGHRIFVYDRATLLIAKLESAGKARSSSILRSKLRSAISFINATLPFADGTRASLLRTAVREAKVALNSSSVSRAKAPIAKALKSAKTIRSLGVF